MHKLEMSSNFFVFRIIIRIFGHPISDNTKGVDIMTGRNDGNAKSRGEHDRPSKHPNRLDQFADDMFGDEEKGYTEKITAKNEKPNW